MSLCRGRMIVANLLIRVPRLINMGILTKKVDLFTCTGLPASEAGTKPPLPPVGSVGMFMLRSKGLGPVASSPGVLFDIGVVGRFSLRSVEAVAYSLYWALRVECCSD